MSPQREGEVVHLVPNHLTIYLLSWPASATGTTAFLCRTAEAMNPTTEAPASIREACRRKHRSRGTSTFPICTSTASR
jgi:hypothetical protein